MERHSKDGERPVTEICVEPREFLSSAAHVKRCMNLCGPPHKAKYSLATDSEPVP